MRRMLLKWWINAAGSARIPQMLLGELRNGGGTAIHGVAENCDDNESNTRDEGWCMDIN